MMTGIVLFLVAVSSIMSWAMALTGMPGAISNGLLSISDNRYIVLLIMMLILLVVGIFMDLTPAVLIFTPIFLPIVVQMGVDPVHFRIMLVFNLEIGAMTPPVGSFLFIVVYIPSISLVIPKLFNLL